MAENHGPCSSGIMFGLETHDLDLVKQLLDEIARTTREDMHAVGSRLEEVTDFIDELRRHPELPETELSALRQAGFATLCELVQACDPNALQQLSSLLAPYLIEGLGYALPQVSASLWLTWLADRRTAEQALREHGLTCSRAAVRLASVRELGKWVNAMNGNFAFRKFTPSIVGLLRDPDTDVRAAAYSLLVRFFAGTKQPARDDLMHVMTRLQFNDKLKEKLLAAISNGSKPENPRDDSASRPSSATSTTSQGSSSSRGSAQQERVNQSPEPDFFSDYTAYLECLRDPSYPMQPISPLDKNVQSDSAFVLEVSKMLPTFEGKETEHNWMSRQQAVNDYRKMLRSTLHEPSQIAIHEAFKLLQRALCEVLSSMRTTLVTDTCQAIKDTCQMMARSSLYHEIFDPMLDALGKVATGIKKITAAAAHLTLCAVFVESPSHISTRQMGFVTQEAKNLKPHARAYAFYWLKAIVVTSSTASLLHWQADVESTVIKAINDAAPAGRAQGRELFWILDAISPNLTVKISKKLGPQAIKALQAGKPKVAEATRINRAESYEKEHDMSIDSVESKGSPPVTLAPPRMKSTTPPRSPTPTHFGSSLHRAKVPPRLLTTTAGTKIAGPHSAAHVESPRSPFNTHSQALSRSSSQASSQASSRASSRASSQGSSREPATTPKRPNANFDTSITKSMADLSVDDMSVSDDSLGTPTPIADRNRTRSPLPIPRSSIASDSVSSNAHESIGNAGASAKPSIADVGSILRKLSTTDMPPEAIKAALNDIKASSPEVSSAAAIAKIIQMDVETSSRSQKEGYLRLLRLLDYETEETPTNPDAPPPLRSEPVVSFPYRANASTPSKPGQSSPIRESIYADDDSAGGDSSASLSSFSSTLSVASSVSGPPPTVLNTKKMSSGEFIGPFASAYPECKAQITGMVNQVKQGTAHVDCLAALAVLVTAASTALGPARSPIHTAVSVWRQHFTLDMELRDAILPFLDQGPNRLSVEQVVVGLILLRTLLSTDAPHAAVYLDGALCLKHLISISTSFGSRSLEIDNHLLPDICKLVLTLRAKMLSANCVLELLMPTMASERSEPKLLGLRAARDFSEVFAGEINEEMLGIMSNMVSSALGDRDVRVRKEGYELLLATRRRYPGLAEQVTQKMSAGQRDLLTALMEQQPASE